MANTTETGSPPSSAACRDLNIHVPTTEREREQYYDLRWRVLRQPWSQDRGKERDEFEDSAIHLGAWYGDRIVGVGRIHLVTPALAQVRYMAVETAIRGQGIGSRILSALEEKARQAGAKQILLHARDGALSFYRRHGYSITRESGLLFESIAHWEMQKTLEN